MCVSKVSRWCDVNEHAAIKLPEVTHTPLVPYQIAWVPHWYGRCEGGYGLFLPIFFTIYQARSRNFEKRPLASSWLPVRPSFRMEHLGSHWTDVYEILSFRIFRKCVNRIHIWLKSVENNGYFTWRPLYIFGNFIFCSPCISLWFMVNEQLDAQFFSLYEGWNFNIGNYLFTTDTCFEVLLSFTVVTSIVYNPLPAMWKS